MILAFDPSSSAIGFAAMRSPGDLAQVGIIRPEQPKASALTRLPDMLDEARALVLDIMPSAIAIEMPGKHARKHGKQTGAALGIYGAACGMVWQLCRMLAYWPDERLKGMQVLAVDSGQWSRSSKEARHLGVHAQFPMYRRLRDPGMDASDAVALAQWFFGQQALDKQATQERIAV